MKTRNYNITIRIRNVPADDQDAIELELFDVIKAIRQLPYDFHCDFERDGAWL